MESGKLTNIYIIVWTVAILVIALFYFLFDPAESEWMPQCIFYKVTGLQCMGCGTQRVIHSLLHGDISSAWQANRFLVISLPFLIFLIWVELTRLRHPKIYSIIHTKATIITIAAMLFAWLLIRNIFGM